MQFCQQKLDSSFRLLWVQGVCELIPNPPRRWSRFCWCRDICYPRECYRWRFQWSVLADEWHPMNHMHGFPEGLYDMPLIMDKPVNFQPPAQLPAAGWGFQRWKGHESATSSCQSSLQLTVGRRMPKMVGNAVTILGNKNYIPPGDL